MRFPFIPLLFFHWFSPLEFWRLPSLGAVSSVLMRCSFFLWVCWFCWLALPFHTFPILSMVYLPPFPPVRHFPFVLWALFCLGRISGSLQDGVLPLGRVSSLLGFSHSFMVVVLCGSLGIYASVSFCSTTTCLVLSFFMWVSSSSFTCFSSSVVACLELGVCVFLSFSGLFWRGVVLVLTLFSVSASLQLCFACVLLLRWLLPTFISVSAFSAFLALSLSCICFFGLVLLLWYFAPSLVS